MGFPPEVGNRFPRAMGSRHPAPVAGHDEDLAGEPSALVLSGDAESRRRLRGALALAGWRDQSAVIDVADLRAIMKRHHELVVVDLVHPPLDGDEAVGRAAATIARRPGTLLVTCGDAESADHESWARAHAAFCHLAGAVSSATLVSVLEQARGVVERVSPSLAPAA